MADRIFRFPKSVRLHLRKEISDLFNSGNTINAFPVRAKYKICTGPGIPLQMAVSVPKKHVKLAVNRNRIKRQIREIFRLKSHPTREYFAGKGKRAQIMFIYANRESLDYAVLESKIILILQRLQEKNELGAV